MSQRFKVEGMLVAWIFLDAVKEWFWAEGEGGWHCYRISCSVTGCPEKIHETGHVEVEDRNGEEKVRIDGVKVYICG